MLGNECEACGLEHVDDNTLQSHVSKNVKCRRKIQHSRAQRLVEAYRDALRARRGARPRSPVHSRRSYGGDAAERAAVEPAAVTDQPDPPEDVEEESDGDESVISMIDDGFNTLIELYIFFREADLSRREVNRLLNIFQNPNFSLRDVRRWLNFVDVRRFGCDKAPKDQVPWMTKDIKCYGPRGRMCTLLLHYRDTELATQGTKEGHARKRGAHPRGDTWFSTGANYAAFEHRGMMQVMPLLIADNMEKSKQSAKAKREREVAAFVAYASFYKALVGVTSIPRSPWTTMVAAIKAAFPDQTSDWNIPKVHQIVHLIDGVPLRGMPNETSTNLWEHTHKGTVKESALGPRALTRGVHVVASTQAVRRIKLVLTKTSKRAHVDEDLDAVMWAYREAHGSDMDALAGCMVAAGIPATTIEVGNVVGEGGCVMVSAGVIAGVKVHTAVAIPRTRGGELVPKGTFVKASPSERWFSDIAVYRSEKEEWYVRCLCIFRAEGADGEMGRHVYVKYYEAEGTCPMTTCL
ncbi:unnamed protein product [Closterium sp. NIES-64]|nr:unnamed protein product [Closterium sp. NIES-64]